MWAGASRSCRRNPFSLSTGGTPAPTLGTAPNALTNPALACNRFHRRLRHWAAAGRKSETTEDHPSQYQERTHGSVSISATTKVRSLPGVCCRFPVHNHSARPNRTARAATYVGNRLVPRTVARVAMGGRPHLDATGGHTHGA